MAQLTDAIRLTRFGPLVEPRRGSPTIPPQDRVTSFLYFPLETGGVLTSFRKKVLNYIYRVAYAESGGRLESAIVSLTDAPDEKDSLHLDLTLTVNADWDGAQRLTEQILDSVSGWSKEWSPEDQADYGRWIYFGVIPSQL